MQHHQPQLDPNGNHILSVCPAECQWISILGQQQHPVTTDCVRGGLGSRKYLFVVVNDAELGNSRGSQWSLLVMDIEAGIASRYPPFQPQLNAARPAAVTLGCILRKKFAFCEESQTPHQNNGNPTKTASGSCGPSALHDKIFPEECL